MTTTFGNVSSATATATCPSGYIATGGGAFIGGSGNYIVGSEPDGDNGWEVTTNGGTTNAIEVTVNCL